MSETPQEVVSVPVSVLEQACDVIYRLQALHCRLDCTHTGICQDVRAALSALREVVRS
jgi:hypothetical protein